MRNAFKFGIVVLGLASTVVVTNAQVVEGVEHSAAIRGELEFEFSPKGDAYDYDQGDEGEARTRVVDACDSLFRAMDLLFPSDGRGFDVTFLEEKVGSNVVPDEHLREAIRPKLRQLTVSRSRLQQVWEDLPLPVRRFFDSLPNDGSQLVNRLSLSLGERSFSSRRYYYDVAGNRHCCDSMDLLVNGVPFDFSLTHTDPRTGEQLVGSIRVGIRVRFPMTLIDS